MPVEGALGCMVVQSFHGPRAQSNVSAREPVVLLTSQRFSAGGRWLSEVMGEMTAGRQDEHCENSREAETEGALGAGGGRLPCPEMVSVRLASQAAKEA